MKGILMPAARIVWDMEALGMRIDPEAVARHVDRLPKRLREIETLILDHEDVRLALLKRAESAEVRIAELVGERAKLWAELGRGKSDLTPTIQRARLDAKRAMDWHAVLSSPQQKAWLLYDALKLETQWRERPDKTRSVTVDKKALDTLCLSARTPENIKSVLVMLKEHEHVSQIFDTFIKPLCTIDSMGRVASVQDRMYSRLMLHRTGTGRLSSGNEKDEKAGESDTNQQNQPKEVRDIYVPDPGYIFQQADWKRVEWLLTLVYANDREGFTRAVTGTELDPEGEDQHKVLAAAIFGVKYRDVTPSQRSQAKKGTHGINYGMGARKLAMEMGILEKEAAEIIRAYKAAFPMVAAWRDATIDEARKRGFLQTVYGWRRWFFGVGLDNTITPKILSHLPQGTGADMCKIAIIRHGGFQLLTATHDSLLQQRRLDERGEGKAAMANAMGQRFFALRGQRFPFDLKEGMSWAECS